MPDTAKADRIGLTGFRCGQVDLHRPPGVNLTAEGHKVAVLAVDPEQFAHRRAILGDKTRMERLAVDPTAFVRPSPASGSLGGVARATSGGDPAVRSGGLRRVIVETVGVGRARPPFREMVDIFVVLMLARRRGRTTGDQARRARDRRHDRREQGRR